MKKWSILLAIGITVALVVVPVCVDGFADLHKNWDLARIANLAQSDTQAAEAELQRWAAVAEDPEKARDYWLIRLEIALKRDDSLEILETVRLAQKSLPEYLVLSEVAYSHFYKKSDYRSALEALELLYSPFKEGVSNPELLNHLAYMRSIALVDLDLALEQIDEALKYEPDSAAYLDTRAWVLFQMGKPLEALEDAQRAVQIATRAYEESESDIAQRVFGWLNGKSSASSSDGLLNEYEAKPLVWGLGVMRYHRGRILESLGRSAEAEEDWQWLREHQLPQDDRLR